MPHYVAGLGGSMRSLYPGENFQHEVLLSNKTENKEVVYNAYEKDIAVLNIFFGKDTLSGW